jgi:GNAT superfamily N-acetyltransferase
MEFELTPELSGEIIFAMEDQTGHFLFDSSELRCVSAPERKDQKSDEDDDRYYAIPGWDSISGFRIMDRFVSQLRNPVVREELRTALSAGHGVFRNFKDILRSHAEIERLWYSFKDREMRNIVLEWYNTLRDFWGLERIGSEPEETDEIVSHDFSFRESNPNDEVALDVLLTSLEDEIAESLAPGLADAIGELCERISDPDDGAGECAIVADSPEGELVGAAFSVPIPEDSFLSAQITMIGVFPEYRGLGIGKELLAKTVEHWTDKGYRWLLFSSPVLPPEFDRVLHRVGFSPSGQISVLDLSDGHH